MTSEDDKPLHKQFLRVQREEDEDTWISGEELKTEGSSGSDDDVPRRKITPRKSRRRRSEGYTPPESRLSLPNLGDNKAGIAFRVSRPDDNDGKGERFSVGGELCAEEERMRMEAAMSRMSTRSSLDRTEEAGDFARCESDWRPKRGSLKLPNLEEETEKTKVIRFSDDIEKFDPPDHRVEVNGFNFEVGAGDEISVEEGDSLKADFDKWKESSMGFSDIPYEDALDEDDIDRYVLKASDSENWKPLLKSKLNLPNFDGDNVDTSVRQFVSEMNEFYNEMSGKLKSLKDCPALGNSQNAVLDLEDEKFMEKENFKNLYKNLKKTPQVKKTLSLISKMDSDISETITKFREERAERLEMQKQLMDHIPRDRNSQLFLQLCEFESKSNDYLRNETREKRNGVNETRKKNRRNMDDKNFIERNIELAKVGMNFSLSDEQKQRLEKILMDEITDEPANDDNRIPSGVRRANQMPNEQNNNGDEVYSNCTINAYRLSDEHKEKLIGIDSALKAYEEDDSRRAGGSGIGVGLVKSLKEIDEKLKSLSTSYIHDEQLLEKNRKKSTGIDIQRLEENVVQNLGLKTSTDLTISTELSI
ncbi:uncharacterized protein LOC123307883 isoform X2 [Coccinella septempunctata]|uniref:uncharacterized protein LOC123307883 isoform X2 n=1 Tax=Coccinella septempunctata TaxID=41139 RepID=UPI001D0933DC|nr:uncharacterized protein LOC123307883 isoform X2 [Coccinella septempunctata]XP_044746293.1 uncharacterized protein LOC123307883 isoform X2 [Coccinella septempunctata]